MDVQLVVCHKIDSWFAEAEAAEYPRNYKAVAVITVEYKPGMLDLAYRYTQHMDVPWWDRPNVVLLGQPEHRSTSIGDVVIALGVPLGDGQRDVAWACMSMGWQRLVARMSGQQELCEDNRAELEDDRIFLTMRPAYVPEATKVSRGLATVTAWCPFCDEDLTTEYGKRDVRCPACGEWYKINQPRDVTVQ